METDILTYDIAFGGVAFEPLTLVAMEWCKDQAEADDMLFRHPDACLTGFHVDAIACDPRDAEDLIEQACAAGLTVKRGWQETYQVHNLSTQTDTLVNEFRSRAAAERCLYEWQSAWPSNQFEIRRVG